MNIWILQWFSYIIAGLEKERVEELSTYGLVACRADVASPDLLMVLGVQFGKGYGISLVTLVRVNTHEGHERMR